LLDGCNGYNGVDGVVFLELFGLWMIFSNLASSNYSC